MKFSQQYYSPSLLSKSGQNLSQALSHIPDTIFNFIYKIFDGNPDDLKLSTLPKPILLLQSGTEISWEIEPHRPPLQAVRDAEHLLFGTQLLYVMLFRIYKYLVIYLEVDSIMALKANGSSLHKVNNSHIIYLQDARYTINASSPLIGFFSKIRLSVVSTLKRASGKLMAGLIRSFFHINTFVRRIDHIVNKIRGPSGNCLKFLFVSCPLFKDKRNESISNRSERACRVKPLQDIAGTGL